MKVVKDNIWKYYENGYWIIVPTNGYVTIDGRCPMGKGLALQTKKRFPTLEESLGSMIRKYGNKVFIWYNRIITFPVKHHFILDADINLIEESCKDLIWQLENQEKFHEEDYNPITKIALPKVGCGAGNLAWEEVEPILDKYFDDRFIVADLK